MWLLNIVYVVLAVILLFGAAVFVHEYGHYWMALRRGMKVEAFWIGFGPKIVSWQRDGVEWSWRWIPAGGLVKLPQMVTSDLVEPKSGEPIESLPAASPWTRILVALSGPMMNVFFGIAIACLLWGVGMPVQINPPIIGYVDPASPEAKLGIQPGDVIQYVDGKPITSWSDVQQTSILARSTKLPVVIWRSSALRDGNALVHVGRLQRQVVFFFDYNFGMFHVARHYNTRGDRLQRQRCRDGAMAVQVNDGQHRRHQGPFVQRGRTTTRGGGVDRRRLRSKGNEESRNHSSVFCAAAKASSWTRSACSWMLAITRSAKSSAARPLRPPVRGSRRVRTASTKASSSARSGSIARAANFSKANSGCGPGVFTATRSASRRA